MVKILIVGEGMLELSPADSGWQLGFGGDTLNTAIHLARFGAHVSFASAIGVDPFSERLRGALIREGIDTSLLLADPERSTGLYAITTDELGERSFTYWRNESAARRMFELPGADRLSAAAKSVDLIYFTLISLAVLPPSGRASLFRLCDELRSRGGRVAFDGNFRGRLWPDLADARRELQRAVSISDLAFPTLEDEIALTGPTSAVELQDRWHALGAKEVVVKLGGDGCLTDGGELVEPPIRFDPVDTSGAGDAFNAGYLNARLKGASPVDAALAGHCLAGWVVMRRGAAPPADSAAPYFGPCPGIPGCSNLGDRKQDGDSHED